MTAWHIVTSEFPPDVGGVSDYTGRVAAALAETGDEVHVWCRGLEDSSSVSGVAVHRRMGDVGPADLGRLSRDLDAFPTPRRLLVQWVPHGYGWRSMNVPFCLWVAARARRGDSVELMVHEPFLECRGPLRHVCMAIVHRLMTVVLLQAATRVWVSTPAWQACLRPFTLGRRLDIDWLPIPAPGDPPLSAPPIRARYAAPTQALIGHFGAYGRDVSRLLEERLAATMDTGATPALLLIGSGSDRYRRYLQNRHPTWASRVHATGYVTPAELRQCLEACDVLLQPYPDGITSRRTSALACLSMGRAVVTTHGHLTERLWADTSSVWLVDGADAESFGAAVKRLLADPDERQRLGMRARRLCDEVFSIDRVITTLRAA